MLRFVLAFSLLASVAVADDLSVDVRDFGAKADGLNSSSVANTAAFRAAILALDAKLDHSTPTRGVVRVPGGAKPYLIDKPILVDRSDIWIVGDGPQSKIWNTGTGPALLVGVRETEPAPGGGVVQLPATARPSRQGKLDGSFGGYGVRTGGNSTVAFVGTPFDLGPPDPVVGGMSAWAVSTLVIDLAIERNDDGGAWPAGRVDGILLLGGYQALPTLAVQKGGGANTIDVILHDSLGQRGTMSVVVGPNPVKKVSLQVDLKAKSVAAWVDRVQVAVKPAGDAFGPNGSGVLRANQRDAMILGVTTSDCDGRPPISNPGQRLCDWTFWGLSLSAYPKYRVGAVGSPQLAASDGRVVNDGFAYGYNDGARCVACILQDQPATPSARYVEAFTGANGTRRFYGLQLQVAQSAVLGGQSRNGIRDLNLIGPGPLAGPTVQLYSVVDFRAERCRISGGTQAIGTFHGAATYPITIDDCDLSASDAPVFGVWASIDMFRCRFNTVGRAAVRTWASNLTLLDARVGDSSPNVDYLIASHGGLYGGRTTIARFEVDFEGMTCRVAPFFVEQLGNSMTTLSAEDVYLGTASRGVPLVIARPGAVQRPFVVDLRRIDDAGNTPSQIVKPSGPVAATLDSKPVQ